MNINLLNPNPSLLRLSTPLGLRSRNKRQTSLRRVPNHVHYPSCDLLSHVIWWVSFNCSGGIFLPGLSAPHLLKGCDSRIFGGPGDAVGLA